MEFLIALYRAGLNLELLQLALGHHPPKATLKVNDGVHGFLVGGASQPAPDPLLNDDCFVLTEYLQRSGSKTNVRPWTRLYQPMAIRLRSHVLPKGNDTKVEVTMYYVDCTYKKYMEAQNYFKR